MSKGKNGEIIKDPKMGRKDKFAWLENNDLIDRDKPTDGESCMEELKKACSPNATPASGSSNSRANGFSAIALRKFCVRSIRI